MPYPHVGKSVHYVAGTDAGYGTQCRAALVTNVWPEDPSHVPSAGTIVNLVVLNDETVAHETDVWYDDTLAGPQAGTWHEIEQSF